VYRYVSFNRYVRLFTPSLQWVPAFASSPPSSVLWDHKTPPHPSRQSPVSLDCTVASRRMLLRSRGRCTRTCPGLVPCCRADLTRSCRRRHEGLPSSWRIPVKACPGLGAPAAPSDLALTVARMLPSARLTASASATIKDFGAESARPASSLSTLRTHQSPGEWQDSLLACQLRL